MRGKASDQSSMLCLVAPSSFVPPTHPLRAIKTMADAALKELSEDFDAMYSHSGRDSVPPETLLKSLLLMALYSVRSERLLCEQLGYNLLFRWFLDMDMTSQPFDHSVFSKNRERLLEHEAAAKFLFTVYEQAKAAGLVSSEHFSVDGTLIEAWASMKSFRPKGDDDSDNNGWGDFSGRKRSNDTHESKTDPEARLMKKGKGKEAKLAYCANALMENRNGLVADVRVELATGTAERDAALMMVRESVPGRSRATVGADAGYDVRSFVAEMRANGVTLHAARRKNGAIDRRTTRHRGYEASQRARKRIESVFGWMKTVGNFAKTRYRGRARTQLMAYMTAAAYNLLRMSRLRPIAG